MSGLQISFHSNSIQSYFGKRSAYWKGIDIRHQGKINDRVCNDMEFSHTHIFGAEVAVQSAASNMLLRNVTIESNVCGIRTTGDVSTNLHIEDSTVNMNAEVGVYVQAHGGVALIRSSFKDNNIGVSSKSLSNLEIVGCSFANRKCGFQVSGVLSNGLIHDTNFSDVKRALYLSLLYHTEIYNVTVQNCTFSAQSYRNDEALYVDIHNSAYRVKILGCVFRDNARGISVSGNGNPDSLILFENITVARQTYQAITVSYIHTPVEIRGSTFSENRGNTISISALQGRGGLIIENCTFVANAGDHVVRLNQQETNSVISNTTFVNNTASTTLFFYDSNQGQLHCTQNSFSNPQAKFELMIDSRWADSYTVDVRYNWWGTTNATSIRSRIRDFFVDMTRAEASISPIFADSPMDSTNTTDITTDFRFYGNKLGGRLTEDTALFLENLTTVGFTIHVPQGKTLTIRSNGTLQFVKDIGILVQGKCQMSAFS